MTTVTQTLTPVEQAHQDRPYLRPDLIPLAAYLITEGYCDGARTAILDAILDGQTLRQLVRGGTLEPADLRGAQRAWSSGRRKRRLRRGLRAAAPVYLPPEADEDADLFDGEEDIPSGPDPDDLEADDVYHRQLAHDFEPPDAPDAHVRPDEPQGEALALADAVEREMLAFARRPGRAWQFVADQLGEVLAKMRLVTTEGCPIFDPAVYRDRIEALDAEIRAAEYDRGYEDGVRGAYSAR